MVTLLTVLLFFMVVGAIIAVETKDLLSSIICVGAVGFGVSIAFLFLRAPDIAITQVVVEVLVLVILIRATISRDVTAISGDREFFSMTVSIALLLVIFIFGLEVFKSFPQFREPVFTTMSDASTNTYIQRGLIQTGAANLVTSIILDYRAYDTLGEATVLFTAILGALAILRAKARKRTTDSSEGNSDQ
ncbi:MAG TPA: DUF4040 domain-containing protein [Candidatus Latescibacteria bacterium]|nr:DUF4040 domain-containing protein [Candidatus Latescibacterota bacterium]